MKTRRNIIGPQVRRLRCNKDWSQERLATELQMHGWKVGRCGVARIESQEIWIGDFQAMLIAEVFDVDVRDLYPKFDRKEPLYLSLKTMLADQIKSLKSPEEILAEESQRLTAFLKENC
jgi:transcriptional regulator with XRE-family HTH domain